MFKKSCRNLKGMNYSEGKKKQMPDVVNVRHCLARSQPGQDKKFALLHFKKLAPDTGKKYLQPTTTTNGVNDQSCRSAISSEVSIPYI